MSITLHQEQPLDKLLQETAERLLAGTPGPHSPFSSFGELEHAVVMTLKWGDAVGHLTHSLARIARQRGVTNGDEPFVWVEEECTNRLCERSARRMCAAL